MEDRRPIIWDPTRTFPDVSTIDEPAVLTHVSVARARRGQYHYLHECSIAAYDGALYAAWANGPIQETNEYDEVYRGAVSHDGGLTWSEPYFIAPGGDGGRIAHNHGSLFVRDGRLYAMVTRWEDRKSCVELMVMESAPDRWRPVARMLDGFIPFNPPRRLANGDWIVSGEFGWETAAVAVSRGDSLSDWEMITLDSGDIRLRYPEVTVLPTAEGLLAIARSRNEYGCSLAARGSADGRSWGPLVTTNFPAADSKPFAMTLSTGHNCLIANLYPHKRTVLIVAVSEPGAAQFSRVYKLRHAAMPVTRFLKPGSQTQWSYPWAIEHEGKLIVIYTQAKEDAALSIVPLSALTERGGDEL